MAKSATTNCDTSDVTILPMVMQVEMAERVLSSDMTSLVTAMKLALKYSKTLLDAEYRREMLQASHVIAVDSKNLLDTVDMARRLQLYRAAQTDAGCDTDDTAAAALNWRHSCLVAPAVWRKN